MVFSAFSVPVYRLAKNFHFQKEAKLFPAHQPLNSIISKLLSELNEFPESHHFRLWNRYLFHIFVRFGHISSPSIPFDPSQSIPITWIIYAVSKLTDQIPWSAMRHPVRCL